jgi:hypothetical protein
MGRTSLDWLRDAILEGARAKLVAFRATAPSAEDAPEPEAEMRRLMIEAGASGIKDAASPRERATALQVAASVTKALPEKKANRTPPAIVVVRHKDVDAPSEAEEDGDDAH